LFTERNVVRKTGKAHQVNRDGMINQWNEALLLQLQEKKLLKTRKIRIDTAVVKSAMHHSTVVPLLPDGVKVSRDRSTIGEEGHVKRPRPASVNIMSEITA
jgi:hypothetical protein